MESVLHVDDVLSAKAPKRLEYRLKMSISIDRTVGSLSNFVHEFLEAVFLEKRGIGTARRRVPVGPYHRHDQSTGPKGP